jgi:hypothetical protein
VLKDCETLFKPQKKCVRVAKGVNNSFLWKFVLRIEDSVTSLYIFDILCFIIKNKAYTTQYSDLGHRYLLLQS